MTTNIIIISLFACLGVASLILALAILSRFKPRQHSQHASYTNEQIYVGNLSYFLKESDLQKYFSRFGIIKSIKIVRNFKTGRSRGYAFVTYQTIQQAQDALAAHGEEFEGRSMVVRIAKPRQQHAYI